MRADHPTIAPEAAIDALALDKVGGVLDPRLRFLVHPGGELDPAALDEIGELRADGAPDRTEVAGARVLAGAVRVEHHCVEATARKVKRHRQPGQPGTDHRDVGTCRHLRR